MGKRTKVDPFEWEETKAEAAKVPQLVELVKTLQTAVEGLSAGLKGGLTSLSATVANDVVSQNIVRNACIEAKEELIRMVVEAAKEALKGSDVINMAELVERVFARIDLEALKELVRQKIEGALLQEAKSILQDSGLACEMADRLKGKVDIDALTEQVAKKVAEKLDLKETAQQVAEYIVDNKEIDLDDLTEKLAGGKLADIVAEKLDLREVARVVAEKIWEDGDYFSEDDIAEKITEAVTQIVRERVRILFEEKKVPEKEGQE